MSTIPTQVNFEQFASQLSEFVTKNQIPVIPVGFDDNCNVIYSTEKAAEFQPPPSFVILPPLVAHSDSYAESINTHQRLIDMAVGIPQEKMSERMQKFANGLAEARQLAALALQASDTFSAADIKYLGRHGRVDPLADGHFEFPPFAKAKLAGNTDFKEFLNTAMFAGIRIYAFALSKYNSAENDDERFDALQLHAIKSARLIRIALSAYKDFLPLDMLLINAEVGAFVSEQTMLALNNFGEKPEAKELLGSLQHDRSFLRAEIARLCNNLISSPARNILKPNDGFFHNDGLFPEVSGRAEFNADFLGSHSQIKILQDCSLRASSPENVARYFLMSALALAVKEAPLFTKRDCNYQQSLVDCVKGNLRRAQQSYNDQGSQLDLSDFINSKIAINGGYPQRPDPNHRGRSYGPAWGGPDYLG